MPVFCFCSLSGFDDLVNDTELEDVHDGREDCEDKDDLCVQVEDIQDVLREPDEARRDAW